MIRVLGEKKVAISHKICQQIQIVVQALASQIR